MVFTGDPLVVVNLILCILIVILGLVIYRRETSSLALSIAIAFGLFGFSHFASLLGLSEPLQSVLIWIRSLAYLCIILALLTIVKRYK
jgi:hypothetical protein